MRASGWRRRWSFVSSLSQPHSQSALFATAARAAEPPHVRRAAEYMDTHFERSVTMAELARVTGMSARSLQVGFRGNTAAAHRSTSCARVDSSEHA